MSTLCVARGDQVAEIYSESHSLWGSGLSLEDYTGLWRDLRATAWGRRRFDLLVWSDDAGRILSSMKVYRPLVRLRHRTSRACVIGAVFTPPGLRRCGHATAMIERLLEDARHDPGIALLFSDIGGFYARFGFRALAAEEAYGTLARARSRTPAGIALRPMEPGDLDAILESHDAWCAGRPLAVVRDRAHWEFLIERAASYFRRLDGSDLGPRFRVATKDGRFAGYVVGVSGAGDWNFREVGAAADDPELTAAILNAAAAEARAAGARTVYGWISRGWGRLVPEWRLAWEPRLRAIPMIWIADGADPPPPDDRDASFLPYMDQF